MPWPALGSAVVSTRPSGHPPTDLLRSGQPGAIGEWCLLTRLQLFVAVAPAGPGAWSGLGGGPTKTAFRPHLAEKPGAASGEREAGSGQGLARVGREGQAETAAAPVLRLSPHPWLYRGLPANGPRPPRLQGEAEALARRCQPLLGVLRLGPEAPKGRDGAVSAVVVLPSWVKLMQ